LIKDSHLGKILVSVRAKFATDGVEVSNKAKDILIEWKKIIETQIKIEKAEKAEKSEKSEKSEKTENIEKAGLAEILSPPKQTEIHNVLRIKKTMTPTATGLNINETIKSEILTFPEARKKVINLFIGHLKLNTTDLSKAENIAFSIDKAVDKMHSFDLDNKGYMGLVRSLAFNLKRNEVCI
jgi:hypothetical protein